MCYHKLFGYTLKNVLLRHIWLITYASEDLYDTFDVFL